MKNFIWSLFLVLPIVAAAQDGPDYVYNPHIWPDSPAPSSRAPSQVSEGQGTPVVQPEFEIQLGEDVPPITVRVVRSDAATNYNAYEVIELAQLEDVTAKKFCLQYYLEDRSRCRGSKLEDFKTNHTIQVPVSQ